MLPKFSHEIKYFLKVTSTSKTGRHVPLLPAKGIYVFMFSLVIIKCKLDRYASMEADRVKLTHIFTANCVVGTYVLCLVNERVHNYRDKIIWIVCIGTYYYGLWTLLKSSSRSNNLPLLKKKPALQ